MRSMTARTRSSSVKRACGERRACRSARRRSCSGSTTMISVMVGSARNRSSGPRPSASSASSPTSASRSTPAAMRASSCAPFRPSAESTRGSERRDYRVGQLHSRAEVQMFENRLNRFLCARNGDAPPPSAHGSAFSYACSSGSTTGPRGVSGFLVRSWLATRRAASLRGGSGAEGSGPRRTRGSPMVSGVSSGFYGASVDEDRAPASVPLHATTTN